MKRGYVHVIIVIAVIWSAWYSYTGYGEFEEAELHEFNVFAAASLTEAVSEIAETFEKESGGGARINCNFASAGILRAQIEQGADCRIFISVAGSDMDKLEEDGLIEKATRINLLRNSLTLIASLEAKELVSMETLGHEGVKSIAIGTPESVPVGKYAMEVIEAMGIRDKVEGKLILAKDVKSVMEYVETGNADCGFVYKTDALLLESATVVTTVSESIHEPIVYPMALIKPSHKEKNQRENNGEETARQFYEYLQGEYAKSIFKKYGFTVL